MQEILVFLGIVIILIIFLPWHIPEYRILSIGTIIFFIYVLIVAIIQNINETLIPLITRTTTSTMQATTRGLETLYSLSIDISTNPYFSAILISLICLVLCINILKSKTGVNAKVEIDSSNRRLKELLKSI